jgi:hypothetical protein
MWNSFSKKTIIFASVLVSAGCFVDLALIYIFGKQIHGYNQLMCTISSLGESTSPVSRAVTIWSVIFGTILIFFGFAFNSVFIDYGKETRKVFVLIIIYGLGENIGSGVFRADHIDGGLTTVAVVHNMLGGIGVIALLLLPLVMIKILTKESAPSFFYFSYIVWAIGLISIIFFSFRIAYFQNSFINTYNGLWQRIFLINFYIYFIAIAIIMMKKINKSPASNKK